MTTILIAEDSLVNKMTYAHILRSANYNVMLAGNGREAWETLQSNDVDLLISDLVMPEMGGAELVTQIRSTESDPQLPIIVLTSVEEDTDTLDTLADQVQGFLSKPTSSWELLDTLATILAQHHDQPAQ